MRASELGFDLALGTHDRKLTHAESTFVGLLWEDHQGEKKKLSAEKLTQLFAWEYGRQYVSKGGPAYLGYGTWERNVRHLQNHLLNYHDNIPILSAAGPNGGYWVAETEEEANEFYETFRKRAMTGMKKASRGKRSAMVDMIKQLSFEFDELMEADGAAGPVRPAAGSPTPLAIVDGFLERMTRDPEKFADGLRKIGAKYGSVLLPKERLNVIRSRVSELEDLVKGLGI